MSTTDDTTNAPRTPTAYERLVSAARKAMIAAYPDKAKALKSGKLSKIEEGFAMDAMGEKGKCMFIHRLDEARQAEEIGDNPDAIFEGLSDSMITFYRKKLNEAKA